MADHTDQKLQRDRWQVAEIGGSHPFALYHFGEDLLFHYVKHLTTEDEVQAFVQDHGLSLNSEHSALFIGAVRIYEKGY